MKCLYGANVTDKNMKIMEICEFFNFQPPYLHDKNIKIQKIDYFPSIHIFPFPYFYNAYIAHIGFHNNSIII